jgi:hypothetical protein
MSRLLHVSALRLKTGEGLGVQNLAPDIASFVCPHFIVPPPQDRDPAQRALFASPDLAPAIGLQVAKYWPRHPALLDARCLHREFGESDAAGWYPRLFSIARHHGAIVTPVVTLKELKSSRKNAIRRAIDLSQPLALAVRIPFAATDGDIESDIAIAFDGLGVSPEQCIAIVDFTEASFTVLEAVVGVIRRAVEAVEASARWKYIVFEGSNYPPTNPADVGGSLLVARNEWLAWKRAISFDTKTPAHFLFGDFCADSSKLTFPKSSGGRAIPHYRYSTPTAWFVVRGADRGTHETTMRDVCRRIVSTEHFAGRGFSLADDAIFRTSSGAAGPGTATNWRQINTTHHITRVVRDMAKTRGIALLESPYATESGQGNLF